MATSVSRPEDPLAALVPDGGAEGGDEIPIHSPVVQIGQGAQNDVTIDDDTVSTQHARLEYDSGSWRVTDLESRNGSYVEGVRLAAGVPTTLAEGAILAFGAVKYRFTTNPGADVDRARADYAPAPEKIPLSERSAFRIPVWLLVLVVLFVAALITLLVLFGGDPATVEPAVEAAMQVAGEGFPSPARLLA